jgi:hypothetical protein
VDRLTVKQALLPISDVLVEGVSCWLDDLEIGFEFLAGTRDFVCPAQRLCGARPATCATDFIGNFLLRVSSFGA